ncbi:MAG TPA: tetratricopeptide repeat protein [Verrucomicrobiae bacterium]|nr:tetratricopeptide repeat protein [Verrucomicrobiae bacterium]
MSVIPEINGNRSDDSATGTRRGGGTWRQRGLVGAVCALVIGVYVCMARSGYVLSSTLYEGDDYYNLLVQGFQAGQLSLKYPVPTSLTKLADPYDPVANADCGVLDMSYYKGKLYLYYGVAPAVLLFWPYAALTGHYLLQKDATLICCIVGFLASVGLLWALWRRYFAAVSVAVVAACALALGLVICTPSLLARCDVWEVPISCGYALTMLALVGIWKAVHEPETGKRSGWLAAASLAYGLAVGSRPPLLFGAVVLLVPVAQSWRERRGVLAALLAATVPIVLVGLGLMLYNALRFGNPFEFGFHYMLSGDRQVNPQPFSPRYLWFNFRVLFLGAAHWSGHFPFVHDITVPPLPAGYGRVDEPFGVLTNIPLVWLALAAPLAWRRRSADSGSMLRGFVTTVGVLFGIRALTMCLFFAACTRYEVEFLPLLALLAVIGILGVECALSDRPDWRRATRWGWGLLLLISVTFNLLVSTERSAEARNNLGMILHGAGRVEEALRNYQEAVWLKPDLVEAHHNLGAAFQGMGQRQKAIEQYEQALRMKPDFAESHNDLGVCLVDEGRVPEAIGHYEQAVRLKPNWFGAHYNLAIALKKAGRMEEAIQQYKEVLRLNPDSGEAHNNLGVVLMSQGRMAEAVQEYEQALQINWANAEAHYNLGIVLVRQGKLREAIGQYAEAARLDPNFAEAHNQLGAVLLLRDKIPEAIEHFEEAVCIRPDYAEAHVGLGNALLQAGNASEAVNHYEQALRIKPDYVEARCGLGKALLNSGDVAGAIEQFELALLIRPNYPEAYNDLGGALFNSGDVTEAIEQFEWTLQIEPGSADTRYNLGAALLQQGRTSEAVEQFEQALRLHPEDAEGHYELAVALEKTGQTEDAIGHYEQALRIKPDFVEAQKRLARLRAAR